MNISKEITSFTEIAGFGGQFQQLPASIVYQIIKKCPFRHYPNLATLNKAWGQATFDIISSRKELWLAHAIKWIGDQLTQALSADSQDALPALPALPAIAAIPAIDKLREQILAPKNLAPALRVAHLHDLFYLTADALKQVGSQRLHDLELNHFTNEAVPGDLSRSFAHLLLKSAQFLADLKIKSTAGKQRQCEKVFSDFVLQLEEVGAVNQAIAFAKRICHPAQQASLLEKIAQKLLAKGQIERALLPIAAMADSTIRGKNLQDIALIWAENKDSQRAIHLALQGDLFAKSYRGLARLAEKFLLKGQFKETFAIIALMQPQAKNCFETYYFISSEIKSKLAHYLLEKIETDLKFEALERAATSISWIPDPSLKGKYLQRLALAYAARGQIKMALALAKEGERLSLDYGVLKTLEESNRQVNCRQLKAGQSSSSYL